MNNPLDVADMQPWAQHYMHLHGTWSNVGYIVWNGQQWEAYDALLEAEGRLTVERDHEGFGKYLADNCVCGGSA